MLQFRLMDSRFFVADLCESIKNSFKKEIKCNKISLHYLAQIGGGQNRLKADSHFKNSHTHPKIAISLALLLGGANIAFAEESGGFIGIGIGGGGTKYIYELKNTATNEKEKVKINRGGINYGFIGGYK